jgi:endogenous inhibitor of DNA gyrase (YacG/DUF329 family)
MVAPGITYRCPTCKKEVVVLKPQDLPTRPFCCSRCKMIDLYKWLNEEIVISQSTRPENEFNNKNILRDEEEDLN